MGYCIKRFSKIPERRKRGANLNGNADDWSRSRRDSAGAVCEKNGCQRQMANQKADRLTGRLFQRPSNDVQVGCDTRQARHTLVPEFHGLAKLNLVVRCGRVGEKSNRARLAWMGVEKWREIAKNNLDHEAELGSRKLVEEILENVVHRSKDFGAASGAKGGDCESSCESWASLKRKRRTFSR